MQKILKIPLIILTERKLEKKKKKEKKREEEKVEVGLTGFKCIEIYRSRLWPWNSAPDKPFNREIPKNYEYCMPRCG